jgi:hypothetical protein
MPYMGSNALCDKAAVRRKWRDYQGGYQVYHVDHRGPVARGNDHPHVSSGGGLWGRSLYGMGPRHDLYLCPGNRVYVALQTGLMEAHEGDRDPANRLRGQRQVLISGGDRIGKLLWGVIQFVKKRDLAGNSGIIREKGDVRAERAGKKGDEKGDVRVERA